MKVENTRQACKPSRPESFRLGAKGAFCGEFSEKYARLSNWVPVSLNNAY